MPRRKFVVAGTRAFRQIKPTGFTHTLNETKDLTPT
jgi:hypothetical protein